MNGRVIFDDKPGKSYHLFENQKSPYNFQNSLKSINSENVLNKTFFAQKIIHDSIFAFYHKLFISYSLYVQHRRTQNQAFI